MRINGKTNPWVVGFHWSLMIPTRLLVARSWGDDPSETTHCPSNPEVKVWMIDSIDCIILHLYIYIWVNYNNSLTWIKAIKGDDFPNINHDSSEGEQWGRYNLPRYMSCISKVIDKSWVGDDTISPKTHDMPSCSISLVCFHFGWTPKFICWLNPDSCWLNSDSGMVNRRNSSKWLTLMNAYSWYSWYNCP